MTPVPTRRDPVYDVLHGQRVLDPYRWLEEDGPEVKEWIAAQNHLTEATLARFPERTRLRQRLTELFSTRAVTKPKVRPLESGRYRYFFTERRARDDQPRLLARAGHDGDDTVLVDPDAMAAPGTLSLDWFFPSSDGRRVAYGLSARGSEQSILEVIEVGSRRVGPESIAGTNTCSLSWLPDGSGFYYSRLVPASGICELAPRRCIYLHRLGEDPRYDRLVFEPDSPSTYPACALSPNGRWLLVTTQAGWTQTECFLCDTWKGTLKLRRLTGGEEQIYQGVPADDALYLLTNAGAPRYTVLVVDPRQPDPRHWRTILPEHPTDVLDTVHVQRGELLVGYQSLGQSRLERFALDGSPIGGVTLPVSGTSSGFEGWHEGREAFFDFESFVHPREIYRLDLITGSSELWLQADHPVDPAQFVVTSHHARSRDGTAIPYVTVRGRAVEIQGGDSPSLLHGYGGFALTPSPRFRPLTAAFLEYGGVYVQAHLRGGSELGSAWHRAGQRELKQNVFDDFIAVSEDLIRRGVTRPSRLAIIGRSNGGLLTAAAITQRPDLFAAAVSSAPLTDMLRFHRFLLGRLWIPEYGCADLPRDFAWLLAYSPYHRVRPNVPYPAVLLTTGSGDTRVAPLHARKFAAVLQHATSSTRPVLLRHEADIGHGAGNAVTKQIAESTDICAFIMMELGMASRPNPAKPEPDSDWATSLQRSAVSRSD